MAGVAEGIVGRLIGAAVGSAAGRFLANLGQAFHIAKLHHRDVGGPGPVQEALRAIRLEFGRDGQLTERLNALFETLSAEDMFSAIIADAFYRTRNEDLRNSFLAFYARYFPEHEESQAGQLYRELQNIAAVYVDYGLKGSPLYFLFREDLVKLTDLRLPKPKPSKTTNRRGGIRRSSSGGTTQQREFLALYDVLRERTLKDAETFAPLISIEYEPGKESFIAALRRLKPWFFVPEEVVAEVSARHRRALLHDTEAVQVFGPRGRISAPFDEIYVKPELDEIDATVGSRGQEVISGFSVDPDHLLSPGAPSVVLGHPGVGKTSVSRYLIRRTSTVDGGLAVVIELRKYMAQKKQTEGHTLLQHAVQKVSALAPDLDAGEVRNVLLYSAFLGRVTFVYDGLDEILEIGNRAATAREISRIAGDFPRALHLTTSRLVGYERAPIKGWRHHRIRPFNRSRMAEYVRRATTHIISVPEAEREEFVSKFLEQASRTAELAEIPLLLALMTVLFSERGHQLPDQRHEIYEECAKLLFIRWDETREILPELDDRYRLSQLLNRLASRIYNDRVLQAGVSREWLEEACGEFFTEVFGGDKARGRKVGADFAEYVTDRAWVFTKTGTDSYEFTHRTFLEYYYSEHVSESRESLQELLDFFGPKIRAGQMTVVAHLSLQRYVNGSLPRSNRLAEALRKMLIGLPERERAQTEVRICDFIADAVDYLAPGDAELRGIIETLTTHASATVEWRAALYRVLRRARHNRNAVFDGVIAGLAEATRMARGKALASVYDYLYAVRLRRRGLIEGSHNLPLAIKELADAIEARPPDESALKFSSGPASLKLRWDCYGQDADFDAFVFKAWESSVLVLERADWLGLDAALLLRGLAVGDLEPRERRLLSALGKATFAANDLQRFPTGRTVYWGRPAELEPIQLRQAARNLFGEDLRDLVAALAIVRDYQAAAEARGGGTYLPLNVREIDELICTGLDRLVASGADAAAATVARFREMEPKVVAMRSVGRMLPVDSVVGEQTLFPWLEGDSVAV